MIDGWTILGVFAFLAAVGGLAWWLDPGSRRAAKASSDARALLMKRVDEEEVHTRNEMRDIT